MTAHEWTVRLLRAAQRGGVRSDDARMSMRYMYSLLNTYRNKNILIQSDYGKIASLLKYVEQPYGCRELCEVDKAECDEHLWGCKVQKVCSLPRFLSLPEHRAISYVGLIDKGHPFKYAEPSDIAMKKKTPYGAKFSFFYMLGDALYVVPSKKFEDIETIDIRGVFADPSEVDDKINPDIDVATHTIDFPMLSTTEDEVVSFVLQELGFTIQTPAQVQNVAQDLT